MGVVAPGEKKISGHHKKKGSSNYSFSFSVQTDYDELAEYLKEGLMSVRVFIGIND